MNAIFNATGIPVDDEGARRFHIVNLDGKVAELCHDTCFVWKELPNDDELQRRADVMVRTVVAQEVPCGSLVMIGGPMYFVPVLEREMARRGYRPVYGFREKKGEDGPFVITGIVAGTASP